MDIKHHALNIHKPKHQSPSYFSSLINTARQSLFNSTTIKLSFLFLSLASYFGFCYKNSFAGPIMSSSISSFTRMEDPLSHCKTGAKIADNQAKIDYKFSSALLTKVKMMQLNTWLIPVRAGFPHIDFEVRSRATKLGKWIEEEATRGEVEIATFQEVWNWSPNIARFDVFAGYWPVFGRSSLESSIRKVLPYCTQSQGSPFSLRSYPIKILDSGLLIASKYPIIEEDFQMFSLATGEDALASKGILVAAISLPDGTIVIACSTHLDAGIDDSIRLQQMKEAIAFIESFADRIRQKQELKGCEIDKASAIVTILGADLNIDGSERIRAVRNIDTDVSTKDDPDKLAHEKGSSQYFSAQSLLEEAGFKDAWVLESLQAAQNIDKQSVPDSTDSHIKGEEMTQQQQLQQDQRVKKEEDEVLQLSDEKSSKQPSVRSSATFDHIGFEAQRLDYLWVKGHVMYSQESTNTNMKIVAENVLSDDTLWASSLAARRAIAKAEAEGDHLRVKRLVEEIDVYNRKNRLTDHACITTQLWFHKSKPSTANDE